MPVLYDECDKYRWTHRPREFQIKWHGRIDGKTRYPFRRMQIADFFTIADPVHLRMVHNALYQLQRRHSEAGPFRFTVRPVRGSPAVYVCRRVE
jgi:hypothetical protein